MAVFCSEYHLDRAIEKSLAVRNQIQKLPAQQNGIDFLPQVSIGIHSGEMVSGNIGSANLGRLDYTVIGDVVNSAQRLQSTSKAGQILLEEKSYEKTKESFNCRRVGELTLKNKQLSLVAYEVIN